ncbi:MAG: hypothetical protein Metus_0729 [Candidatus Methanosuratincola subterraneus]|uniref:Uncharacterized protein n=1 Tax=Methanosuratincola subterraneus TaxID=2593994 RepID=A0A444L8V6_METS7|nr:MAG: hypothetical protein Metus_0729 [Candidatus Methanosuratincola subterraneus]
MGEVSFRRIFSLSNLSPAFAPSKSFDWNGPGDRRPVCSGPCFGIHQIFNFSQEVFIKKKRAIRIIKDRIH